MRAWSVPGVLLLAAMSGCYNYHAGRLVHVDNPPAIAWPERDASVLQPLADATPYAVFQYERVPETEPTNPDPQSHSSTNSVFLPEYALLDKRIVAGGLLRTYAQPSDPEPVSTYFESLAYGFHRNASFISAHWFNLYGPQAIADARDAADSPLVKAMHTGPGYRPSRPTAGELLLTGSNIALGIPDRVAGEKGILVHIPALVGNPYEQHVVDSLEADGWTVVHVESDTNLRGPGYQAREQAELARVKRVGELANDQIEISQFRAYMDSSGRFHFSLDEQNEQKRREIIAAMDTAEAQAAEEIPMPEIGFEIHPDDDLQAKGALIADYMNEHLADHAYAAEAAIDLVDDRLPDLAHKPIVVIGFSAGSLVAPTIAARLRELYPDRVAAMILVGSGASIFDVAHLSSLTDGGLVLTPEGGPEPSLEAIEEVRTHYLEHASLDPYNIAPHLADLPVLHIYADSDHIVPVSTARVLNDRLGAPDRLIYSGGHLGLFYFLPSRRPRIHLWLDRAMEAFHARHGATN